MERARGNLGQAFRLGCCNSHGGLDDHHWWCTRASKLLVKSSGTTVTSVYANDTAYQWSITRLSDFDQEFSYVYNVFK